MKYIVKTDEEWHALREKVVTASESAALVGADPYMSPAKLRKASEFTGNAYTDVGHLLEPIVVEKVNEALDAHFSLYETAEGEKEFYVRGSLGATPDAHQDRSMLLECKTANSKAFLRYGVVPPDKYLVQLQTQIFCTEMTSPYHYLAILNTQMKGMGKYYEFLENPDLNKNWPISIFKVLHNEKLCTILKTEAERFKKDSKFKVDKSIKQKVKLLLATTWEKIV